MPTAHISILFRKKMQHTFSGLQRWKLDLFLHSPAHLVCRKLKFLAWGIKTGSSSKVTQNPFLFLAHTITAKTAAPFKFLYRDLGKPNWSLINSMTNQLYISRYPTSSTAKAEVTALHMCLQRLTLLLHIRVRNWTRAVAVVNISWTYHRHILNLRVTSHTVGLV